jgi:16S rRNA processing protein RimM
VALGVLRGAYGVKGWARVMPYDAQSAVLGRGEGWWLVVEGRPARPLVVKAVKRHGATWLAKWDGCDSPEAAEAQRGAEIAVARSQFPPLAEGEYYWVDLIGATVCNREGEKLGTVRALANNGAQDLLEVQDGERVILIPLVPRYVESVDAAAAKIVVDWQADW